MLSDGPHTMLLSIGMSAGTATAGLTAAPSLPTEGFPQLRPVGPVVLMDMVDLPVPSSLMKRLYSGLELQKG